VHLIVNNQIGFHDFGSARCALDDLLHRRREDGRGADLPRQRRRPRSGPVRTQLALDFRQQFHKDVVVDIVCFRKLGHNEQDEPFVTQPLMYKKITQHPGTRKLYADKLVAQHVVPSEYPEQLIKSFRAALDAGQHTLNPVISNFKSKFAVDWAPLLGAKWTDHADTQVPIADCSDWASG
jgi:2-oxoglutarate dehydrogenase E1 component